MEKTAGPRKVTLATGALRPLGALVALAAAAMITAPVALGQPSPDPAPLAPTIAPDAAPTRRPRAASRRALAGCPSPTRTNPVRAALPPAAVNGAPASANPRSPQKDRPASRVSRAERKTTEADRALPRPVATPAFLRLETLVPAEGDNGDPSSTPMLLAAGALLALVLASGSFVSVLARLMPPTAVLLVVLATAAPAHAESARLLMRSPRRRATGAAAGTRPPGSLSSGRGPQPPGRSSRAAAPMATFTSEGPAFKRSCRVLWGSPAITKEVWIGIDRTAPQVTALQPDRPPDYNGWFSRPVAPEVHGHRCAIRASRRAPGRRIPAPRARASWSAEAARMLQGTRASASLPLNYDATPPASPQVEAVPGNRRVALEVVPAPDAGGGRALSRRRIAALIHRGPGPTRTPTPGSGTRSATATSSRSSIRPAIAPRVRSARFRRPRRSSLRSPVRGCRLLRFSRGAR